ncbi:MAG: UDP-N-acetylmuramate--L-alanine ligase [Bacillota bacterium]
MAHVHMVGIGGAGMSAIAQVLLAQGDRVSGSDIAASDVTERLAGWGARVTIGHRPENVPADADMVVVSRAIDGDNPEVQEALRRGLPLQQRGEMLARIMDRSKGVAVAGTHGKTTTTSMTALVLERGGLDPAVLVGGTVPHLGGNARAGHGPFVVAEADESDGSFLLLHPHIAVVTNVEADHLDHWGDLDHIVDGFRRFLDQVDQDGLRVVCADDPLLRLMADEGRAAAKGRAADGGRWRTYGLVGPADLMGLAPQMQGIGSRTEVRLLDKRLGVLELQVPGLHNINNALAATAVGLEAGLDFETIAGALCEFTGVQRRFQLRGEAAGVRVVDDYGHHPSEIRVTLRAARQASGGRVIVCFQPHRYTRTKFLLEEFGQAFRDADHIYITDIYAASEKPIPGLSGQAVVDAIHRHTGQPAEYVPSLDDLPERVADIARAGDLVLTLGAGNIWRAGAHILESLAAREGGPGCPSHQQ